jgi:dCTP deaminase
MILSDIEILKAIEEKLIVLEPFKEDCLGTNSYDVHLGKYLATYKDEVLDARKHNEISVFQIPEEGFVLQPNTLYLGATQE